MMLIQLVGFATLLLSNQAVAELWFNEIQSLSMPLPIRVALVIPPDGDAGNHALLDQSELQSVLSILLPQHNTTFYDGFEHMPGTMSFDIAWKVETLPLHLLHDYEDRLAKHLTPQTGSVSDEVDEDTRDGEKEAPDVVRRRREEALRRGIGVPISLADDFLSDVMEEHFETQSAESGAHETVIFVLAPRKRRIFGAEQLRRRRYHYVGHSFDHAKADLRDDGHDDSKSKNTSPTNVQCTSAWVGRGRYLALDLAAGPCGDNGGELEEPLSCERDEQDPDGMPLAAHLIPYVGDGSQGPRTFLDMMGLQVAPPQKPDSGTSDFASPEHERFWKGSSSEETLKNTEEMKTVSEIQEDDEERGEVGEGNLDEEDGDEEDEEEVLRLASSVPEEDEDEEIAAETLADGNVARNLLTAQVATVAVSAVETVLCPPVGSPAGHPFYLPYGPHGGAGFGYSSRHEYGSAGKILDHAVGGRRLARVPRRTIVPIHVITSGMPECYDFDFAGGHQKEHQPDSSFDSLLIQSVVNVTTIQRMLEDAIPDFHIEVKGAQTTEKNNKKEAGVIKDEINDLLEPKHVVTVVASVHGIEEAPKVSVAAARAVQSKVERRKIKDSGEDEPQFHEEEVHFISAPTLLANLRRAAVYPLTRGILNELGIYRSPDPALGRKDKFDDHDVNYGGWDDESRSEYEAEGEGWGDGAVRVVPVIVLSNLAAFRKPQPPTGVPGAKKRATDGPPLSFENNFFATADDDMVVVLHATANPADACTLSMDSKAKGGDQRILMPLPDVSNQHGKENHDQKTADASDGISRSLSLDSSDATAHVAAGLLGALTGIAPPPMYLWESGRSERDSHEVHDFTWAVGHHPFRPFSIEPSLSPYISARERKRQQEQVQEQEKKKKKRSGQSWSKNRASAATAHKDPAYEDEFFKYQYRGSLSPIYSDAASRCAVVANIRVALEALAHLDDAIFEVEDAVTRGMMKMYEDIYPEKYGIDAVPGARKVLPAFLVRAIDGAKEARQTLTSRLNSEWNSIASSSRNKGESTDQRFVLHEALSVAHNLRQDIEKESARHIYGAEALFTRRGFPIRPEAPSKFDAKNSDDVKEYIPFFLGGKDSQPEGGLYGALWIFNITCEVEFELRSDFAAGNAWYTHHNFVILVSMTITAFVSGLSFFYLRSRTRARRRDGRRGFSRNWHTGSVGKLHISLLFVVSVAVDAYKSPRSSEAAYVTRKAISGVAKAKMLLVGGVEIPHARPSPVSRILEGRSTVSNGGGLGWPREWPYETERDLMPEDSNNDKLFYLLPKLVHHAGEESRTALTEYYRCVLPPGRSDGSVLDLCSSWTSHYPPEFNQGLNKNQCRCVAIGLNFLELVLNPSKTAFICQDLNVNPQLPFDDDEFDLITNSLSVDYLTSPREIFNEMFRVLKPGGRACMAFTNRAFMTKVVPIWRQPFSDINHAEIVARYFYFSGDWEDIAVVDVSPSGWVGQRDPMYVVQARKPAS